MMKRLLSLTAFLLLLLLLLIPRPALAQTVVNSWGDDQTDAIDHVIVNTSSGGQIQAGDVLVCSVSRYSGSITPPSGFSVAVPEFNNGGTGAELQIVYYKVTAAG